MKELGNFLALEGLDGVGKSTTIQGLREKGYTVLKTPPSEIASIRTIFDSQQLRVRFMYYLTGVMMAGDQAVVLSAHEKVFCDRYLLTTVAAHNAMGLEESFLSSLTPIFDGIPAPEATIL
jgi:thymidylate kinase